jgi:DNA mismatch repair protein MutL
MITLTNEEGVSQQLLFPQTIEMNQSDATMLRSMLTDLNLMGIDIREFGPDTFIINGFPAYLDEGNAKAIVESMLERMKTTATNIGDKMREELAISLAIASSVNHGHQLNTDEAAALIDSLFACQTPNFSPTGKPVIEIIKTEEIEKRLK